MNCPKHSVVQNCQLFALIVHAVQKKKIIWYIILTCDVMKI